MSRPLLTLFGAVGAAAFTCLTCARAALADSEPPPPGTFTGSDTGAIVVLTLGVVAIIFVSVVVLRRISRARRERWLDEEQRRRRETGAPGGPPDAGEGTSKEAP
jgi:hypothetical protein